MNAIRWKLFRMLSAIGWWICPEPQRSELQEQMATWRAIDRFMGHK